VAYTVTDIAEMIEYHLVASAPDDDTVDDKLGQLVSEIQRLSTRPLWRETTRVFCDRCGCSVDTELIHPGGHHYSDDDDFYCADCWGQFDV